MQYLYNIAMNAWNRISLNIQYISKLIQFIEKVNIFALTKIKSQLVLAKKDENEGILHLWLNLLCNCHTYNHYELFCRHRFSIDDAIIELVSISSFWYFDNWDQDMTSLSLLIARAFNEYCRHMFIYLDIKLNNKSISK